MQRAWGKFAAVCFKWRQGTSLPQTHGKAKNKGSCQRTDWKSWAHLLGRWFRAMQKVDCASTDNCRIRWHLPYYLQFFFAPWNESLTIHIKVRWITSIKLTWSRSESLCDNWVMKGATWTKIFSTEPVTRVTRT